MVEICEDCGMGIAERRHFGIELCQTCYELRSVDIDGDDESDPNADTDIMDAEEDEDGNE